ncbi:hypothetical protein POM88_052518 [Heracleum sosnowskyi]|uniref:Uncharacterized protein n=1 Tax=Heracleum sosnowskyi TaxID=360622 RepID=A0AAD8GSR4_9APIA|nr:hypothetical protein POM88_052518 [Heracleum sosnowskyi]
MKGRNERIISRLKVHQTMKKKVYKVYLDDIDCSLSEVIEVQKRMIRVLNPIPRYSYGKLKNKTDYHNFLPTTLENDPCDLILKIDDLYLMGVDVWGAWVLPSHNPHHHHLNAFLLEWRGESDYPTFDLSRQDISFWNGLLRSLLSVSRSVFSDNLVIHLSISSLSLSPLSLIVWF